MGLDPDALLAKPRSTVMRWLAFSAAWTGYQRYLVASKADPQ